MLLISNWDFNNFVSDYLILIMGLGHWRSRNDAVDKLGHVNALMEERFEYIVVRALA